jgi:hypothetical protein
MGIQSVLWLTNPKANLEYVDPSTTVSQLNIGVESVSTVVRGYNAFVYEKHSGKESYSRITQ